ncbi:hypothetical protein VPNG_06169 [Cytospora leucostoma]|uniref:Uncharacterized protein n=1 Tax=Cytospora leucostoma TaxID=1230097 RepID=A0A423WYH6_9PEZI|nr:hypothetical protein VPNG_06169 [Cytospora leucostoma]
MAGQNRSNTAPKQSKANHSIAHRSASRTAARPVRRKYFNLMGLPLELRILIYEHALGSYGGPKIFHIKFRKSSSTKPYYQTFKVPEKALGFMGMLSAGKALRIEAAEYFYSHQFEFEDIIVLQTFLCRVPQATLSHIRNISFAQWNTVVVNQDRLRTPVFALLRGLGNLQTVRFPGDLMSGNYGARLDLLPTPPGGSVTHTVGKTCAAQLYRYCYPLVDALIEQGGASKLKETIQVVDMAFLAYQSDGIMHDITPQEGDTPQQLQDKAAAKVQRVRETRAFFYKVLITLNRNPAYRATTMKELGKCRY